MYFMIIVNGIITVIIIIIYCVTWEFPLGFPISEQK